MNSETRRIGGVRAINARGLTLIEVLIVIAILLAIGGLVVVNLLPAKEGADINTQRIQFQNIDAAMKMFKLDMKRWPTEDEGLAVLNRKDAIQEEAEQTLWHGPYLESDAFKDKWNHAVVYKNPSEALGDGYYDLLSYGPDGQEGTGDDITNHDNRKNADGEIESPSGNVADTFAPPPSGGG